MLTPNNLITPNHVTRRGSAEDQVAMAERVVKLVGMPNLLLDRDVDWEVTIIVRLRANSTPRGYQSFQFSDSSAISSLNLPNIGPEDIQHLRQFTTGPYIIRRQVKSY